jgi:hypothetical protein
MKSQIPYGQRDKKAQAEQSRAADEGRTGQACVGHPLMNTKPARRKSGRAIVMIG